MPVPIEDIADTHLGLLCGMSRIWLWRRAHPELTGDQALSGLLLPDRGEIWVDAGESREWPARRRFTIAHELGHWRLHRHGDEAVYCRSSVVDSDVVSARPALPAPEEEANAFAAAVLMPAQLIRDQYVACERDFDRLCRTFGSWVPRWAGGFMP